MEAIARRIPSILRGPADSLYMRIARMVGAIMDIFWKMDPKTTPNFCTVWAKTIKVAIKVKPINTEAQSQSLFSTSGVIEGLPITNDAVKGHTK